MTPPGASAAAAPAINPRRTTNPRRAPAAPRRSRRISGPANPTRGRAGSIQDPARSQARGWAGPLHVVGLAEAVTTHRLLDRLIHGRIWIGVIAFALIGIVTMQLGLLKLNAGIGRTLQREALLQRENATLSAENSEMAAGERVEAQAERMGMEPIPPGALHFLSADPSSDASKGAAALSSSASTTATAQSETAAVATPEATTSTSATPEAATSTSATSEAAPGASSASAGATAEAATQASAPAETTTPASTTAETPASGAGTEASSGGAGVAASPAGAASIGGGTTPGG